MAYYNILYFVKNIFYNFRKCLKYIVLIFIIGLIFYCLLRTDVKAVTYESGYSTTDMENIIATKDTIVNNDNITYTYWFASCSPQGTTYITFFDIDTTLYVNSNGNQITTLAPVSGRAYKMWYLNSYTLDNAFSNVYLGNPFGFVNGNPLFVGNTTLYANDKTTILWEPEIPTVILPFLEEYNGSYDYLEDNTFNYYHINCGSFNPISPILFRLQNTTGVNDISNAPSINIVLNSSSPYYKPYMYNQDFIDAYAIPKSVLDRNIFKQVNGESYFLTLYFINDINDLSDLDLIATYTFTFNMTAQVVADVQQQTQQDILAEQQQINNFIGGSNVDTTNMALPEFSINTPIVDLVNGVFDGLYSAFTSNETLDFTFNIPFSNSSITIPSNYIESHLPSIIINLIRLVYWYIISRYIVKDIMHFINDIRQGDFLSGSDDNIKTEVL